MLVDLTVRDLLASFSSSAPTPGGGSASALASAVGTSLLLMVAGLPKTRTNSDEDRTRLAAATAALAPLAEQLADAIDADAAAYDAVVAAYRLPKSSPDEQQARTTAIQRALRAATDVPLGVMRLSAKALEQAVIVAAHGHAAAASDIGVARSLLRAGGQGARLNVEINLDGVKDAAYAETIRSEVQSLASQVG